jgi:hypothetical protein
MKLGISSQDLQDLILTKGLIYWRIWAAAAALVKAQVRQNQKTGGGTT